jgi:hypothetical protein
LRPSLFVIILVDEHFSSKVTGLEPTMTQNLFPEWFDVSLSILLQQGLVEEASGNSEIPKYKLTKEGKKSALQSIEVMYKGKLGWLRWLLFPCYKYNTSFPLTYGFSLAAGYSILDDTRQLHLRRSARTPKQRRFLRPSVCAARSWVDLPTTGEEETGKVPKEVSVAMWFATPRLYDGQEQEIESGVLRAVKLLPSNDQTSFAEMLDASAVVTEGTLTGLSIYQRDRVDDDAAIAGGVLPAGVSINRQEQLVDLASDTIETKVAHEVVDSDATMEMSTESGAGELGRAKDYQNIDEIPPWEMRK